MAKNQGGKKFEGVLMTYKELGNSLFHQTLNMLRNAEGLDLGAMSRINLIYKACIKRMDEMSEKYVHSVQKPFTEKLKAAGIDWEPGQNPPDLDEEKTEIYKKISDENEKEIEKFEALTTYVDCIPLGPQHVKDIKNLSAARLDSLGGLFDADGEVRKRALGGNLKIAK